MKKYIQLAIFQSIVFLCVGSVFAQDNVTSEIVKSKKSYWLDAGLGWGGQGGAFNLGLTYEIVPTRLISLGYSGVSTNEHCDEVILFIPIQSPLGKSADAIDFSYGFLRKGRIILWTLRAGVSYVRIENAEGSTVPASGTVFQFTDCPEDYTVTTEGTVGLALRAQFIPSWRWGGFGISPYLNVNPKYTFGSVAFNLSLGRMRPRTAKL